MKRILPAVAFVALMTACNSNQKASDTAQVESAATISSAEDSLVLSQFHAWKAENELKDAREFLGTGESADAAVVPVSKTSTSKTTSARKTTQSGTMTSSSSNTAKAPEKKGWSKAAKGAAIGAGTGAVVGAVVNKKNRVAGGVIGGVVGGAVGYGIGRTMDKKDGRY